jgi:uncharacterized membrane protein
VAVYIPLSTLIFPAWFSFAREPAGALGVFQGAQALGAVLGGLVAAGSLPIINTAETAVTVVVAANAVMVAAFALLPVMRLIDEPTGQDQRG